MRYYPIGGGGGYCPKEDIKKLPKYIFLAVMSPTLAPMLQEYGTCTLHIVHTQKTFKMPYKEEQPSQYYICREFLESIVKDSSVTQIPQGQEDNYIKLPLTLNDSYEQTITDNTPNGMLLRFMTDSFWNMYQGVQAVNSSLRIAKASGSELDKIGEIYRTPRHTGESDTDYRYRLFTNKTKTTAVSSAIITALENLDFIKSAVLYDVSNAKTGFTFERGNIYLCLEHNEDVLTDEQKTQVAQAILDTRAAGILSEWIPEVENNREGWQVADLGKTSRAAKWHRSINNYLHIQVFLTPEDILYQPNIQDYYELIKADINTYLTIGLYITLDKINDIVGYSIKGIKSKNIKMALKEDTSDPLAGDFKAEDIIIAPNVIPILQAFNIEWGTDTQRYVL